MIKCIFLIDITGDILVERRYFEDISRLDLESIIFSIKKFEQPPPFLEFLNKYFIIHKEKDIFFVSIVEFEKEILFCSNILYQISKITSNSLLGGITQETIKSNFSLIYKILDQFIDYGYPFLDEPNILFSSFSGFNSLLFDYRYPWRSTNNIRGNFELLIDVIEYIDAKLFSNFELNNLNIRGSIQLRSKIPDIPLCSLTITCPNKIIETSFHRCVDNRLYNSQRIQFIPPNKDFTLLSYLIQLKNNKIIPILFIPKFTWSPFNLVFEFLIKIDEEFKKPLTDFLISIPFPKFLSEPSISSNIGKFNFDNFKNILNIQIDKILPGTNFSIIGSSSIILENLNDNIFQIINIKFKSIGFVYSGLIVDSLDIEGYNKSITKAIRYSTINGNYSFNINFQ